MPLRPRAKYQAPRTNTLFLAHLRDWSRTAHSGVMVWAPNLGAREGLTELCRQAAVPMHLSSGLASEIRGLATWLESSLVGRCLCGAMCGLITKQSREADT